MFVDISPLLYPIYFTIEKNIIYFFDMNGFEQNKIESRISLILMTADNYIARINLDIENPTTIQSEIEKNQDIILRINGST